MLSTENPYHQGPSFACRRYSTCKNVLKSKLEFEFITEFFPLAVPSLCRSLRIREAEYHCVLYTERNAAVDVDS